MKTDMKRAIDSEIEMRTFGEAIGRHARGGELLELVGDVGAGKTTLTKAIAVGMGIKEPVQSPTFTITNRYESPAGIELAHYDFYRLKDAGIMQSELEEVIATDRTVIVIEWSGIVQDALPEDRLTIAIKPTGETSREVTLHAGGPRSGEFMEQLG